MKTGVIVHGCNLHIENWRHVAWGDPPLQLGRMPQGILVAHQFDAEVIVFGTGASHKPFRFAPGAADSPRLSEAEFSLKYLETFFSDLGRFDVLKQRIPELQADDHESFRRAMLSRIVVDNDSLNTSEEIRNASEVFLQRGVERVILVSSPSHIVRCLRDAASIFQQEPRFAHLATSVFASPSTTCYEGSGPEDVVVIEPPHRPDRHVVPTHRRIQRMLTLQKLPHDVLVQLIEEFDELLQRYEHQYFSIEELDSAN